jgi:hypothetical protein
MVGCCEHSDEPSCSGTTEVVMGSVHCSSVKSAHTVDFTLV